ncbi:sulfurtransferase TusA family protein [Methyloraptor flagellatus]|uniref:Sulfurtransferase TusA family protein n=1 Tax=Methyloraptor flagellatus TaxID=3162530 RepID=A0AAU7X9F7_9HYPH
MQDATNDAPPPRELDLRGLKCPLPVLRARKALAGMLPGERLVVEATDPMAAIDIPHMCHEDGHELLSQTRAERVLRFEIAAGPARDPEGAASAD